MRQAIGLHDAGGEAGNFQILMTCMPAKSLRLTTAEPVAAVRASGTGIGYEKVAIMRVTSA
ncbi:hypothetical protein [Antarcticirhabdus aurantiaca]|uniref:Uncharacterized protein n=1 Tax=Antarcticirhabdus aurantiaca TaxID=2606717 RepID=A0ACD4NNQ2_9HYPH|nr:hypothetical protein [Antarcticirhabdus aurantiaca]WAJ28509.1 hypothetical protein OXU80_27510 [Jeongeuplla avenae]